MTCYNAKLKEDDKRTTPIAQWPLKLEFAGSFYLLILYLCKVPCALDDGALLQSSQFVYRQTLFYIFVQLKHSELVFVYWSVPASQGGHTVRCKYGGSWMGNSLLDYGFMFKILEIFQHDLWVVGACTVCMYCRSNQMWLVLMLAWYTCRPTSYITYSYCTCTYVITCTVCQLTYLI